MDFIYVNGRAIISTSGEMEKEQAIDILESVARSIEVGTYVLDPSFKRFSNANDYKNLDEVVPNTIREAIRILTAKQPLSKERNDDVLDKESHSDAKYCSKTRYDPCIHVIISLLASILTLLFIISAKLG